MRPLALSARCACSGLVPKFGRQLLVQVVLSTAAALIELSLAGTDLRFLRSTHFPLPRRQFCSSRWESKAIREARKKTFFLDFLDFCNEHEKGHC